MADSFGSGFPKNNINIGHTFYDIDNQTLYVFNGGDTQDPASWSIMGGSGSGGQGVISGRQRWTYNFFGTQVSIGFGASGNQTYIIPVNGTIIKWGIAATLLGPEEAIMQLVFDPFDTGFNIDTLTVPGGTSITLFERAVSFDVLAGQLIAVLHANTLNPAVHTVQIGGYVDFLPS